MLEAVVEIVDACERAGGDGVAGCAVFGGVRVDEDREARKAEYVWTPATAAPKTSVQAMRNKRLLT